MAQASAGNTGSITAGTADNKVRDWATQQLALKLRPVIAAPVAYRKFDETLVRCSATSTATHQTTCRQR
jgi:hypothetical protein